MRNCAASAPHATRKADTSRLGNVHSADSAEPPAVERKASTFRFTCAEDSPAPDDQQAARHRAVRGEYVETMGRDQMKSAGLHSFHEGHGAPLPAAPDAGAPTPFETLVREILGLLGEDPAREGLRQTPSRVEASLKWLTRGYGMSVADVIGDALYTERHENLVCVRDIEIYSLCEHHLLPFFGKAHIPSPPNGRLGGLSKIPRALGVSARRLQVQERLT